SCESGPARREPCLAPLADLLRARTLVDAVLGRCVIPQPASAADEESCHAADLGVSRSSPTATKAKRSARCRSTRRGDQDSRPHHRASGRRLMNDRAKIGASHLSRAAYVYLRQSTTAQVEHNRESTQRQYALAARATALGWPAQQVIVIDED